MCLPHRAVNIALRSTEDILSFVFFFARPMSKLHLSQRRMPISPRSPKHVRWIATPIPPARPKPLAPMSALETHASQEKGVSDSVVEVCLKSLRLTRKECPRQRIEVLHPQEPDQKVQILRGAPPTGPGQLVEDAFWLIKVCSYDLL